MQRIFIREFTDGLAVEDTFLVRDKQIRTNRNGNLYLQMELDDRTGAVQALHWNVTEDEARSFEAGEFLQVRGKVQSFQGQLQLIVTQFRPRDPQSISLADFIPSTDKNIDQLMATLREQLGRIRQPGLQAIARAFLMDQVLMRDFMHAPAGIRHHHAYLGGLLEHVVAMLSVARKISDIYPNIDQDLLAMGIFLHDFGKTRELAFARGFQYTDDGQLIGHVVLGVELLNDKLGVAAELLGAPVCPELVMRLKHLIISHHGTLEFGSPRLPMTVEAIALHYLDNLDAKIHGFTRRIADEANQRNSWTAYDPQLGRRLYKGPPPSAPPSPAPTGHSRDEG